MRKIKLYGPFLLGLTILLVISFFLPQMIFQVQDGYRFIGKSVETWEYANNTLVSAGYEKDMYQRMTNLAAKETDDLTISAISYGGKNVDEVVDLLERVFVSDWMGNINEMTMGMYYDFLQETSTINIQDCKKYVVYENTSLENILLMVWYLDIYMVDYDTSVQLLVDVETESVYYISITGMGDAEKVYQQNDKWESVESVAGEYYKISKYEIYNIAPYYMIYFNEYYEAGMEDIVEFNEGGWENEDVWFVTREEYDALCRVSFSMPYGNIGTEFEVCISDGKGSRLDYSAGVTMIRDLIPEMIQN